MIPPKIIVLWHEPSNMLATCQIRSEFGLPLLAVCDEEYEGINPFYSYPIEFLKHYGWIVVGDL